MKLDIRAERLRRGLTLPQLATEIGLPYHVIRRAERGGRVREDNAKTIADYFGTTVFDVLDEPDPNHRNAAA